MFSTEVFLSGETLWTFRLCKFSFANSAVPDLIFPGENDHCWFNESLNMVFVYV